MRREQGASAQSSSREHPGLPAQLPEELVAQQPEELVAQQPEEQVAQQPEELVTPPSPSTHSAPVDDDVSFMQELQQALANNSMPAESQLPLESIAAHSTLNWNANEFRPNPSPVVIKNSRISVSK